MRNKIIRWVYSVLAYISFIVMIAFFFKHMIWYATACFFITQICLFHIKLNDIKTLLEEDCEEECVEDDEKGS